jgi:hypothetical protein
MATINNTNIEFNLSPTGKVPIKRNNLFYDRESYLFEQQVGKEYVEMDMGQTIILYQVDPQNTNQDAIYGETEADSIQFLPPIEVPCIYTVEQPELKSYDKTKNLGTYQKTGKLKIGVYEATLTELGCDIKIGDYVGIQISESHREYWTVVNAGKNNYDNAHTLFGVKPLYRTVQCAPVDPSEFAGN